MWTNLAKIKTHSFFLIFKIIVPVCRSALASNFWYLRLFVNEQKNYQTSWERNPEIMIIKQAGWNQHFTSGFGASSAFVIKFWNNLVQLINWHFWNGICHLWIKIGSKLDQNNLFETSILGIISFQRKMSSQGDEVLHLKLLLKSRRKMIHHVNFDLFYCKKSLTSFWFTVAIVSLEISGFNLGNTFHKNLELSQKKLKIGPKYTRNCDTQMLF